MNDINCEDIPVDSSKVHGGVRGCVPKKMDY